MTQFHNKPSSQKSFPGLSLKPCQVHRYSLQLNVRQGSAPKGIEHTREVVLDDFFGFLVSVSICETHLSSEEAKPSKPCSRGLFVLSMG